MSARSAGRIAGAGLARAVHRHTKAVATRAADKLASDLGEVTKSDGKGTVEVFLPGVGLAVNESDLYSLIDLSVLEVEDEVLVVVVDNEYVLVGPVETPTGETATRSTTKGCVVHDGDANAERPEGYPSVEWMGSAEPSNAEEWDTWSNPGTERKVRHSGSWVPG